MTRLSRLLRLLSLRRASEPDYTNEAGGMIEDPDVHWHEDSERRFSFAALLIGCIVVAVIIVGGCALLDVAGAAPWSAP